MVKPSFSYGQTIVPLYLHACRPLPRSARFLAVVLDLEADMVEADGILGNPSFPFP
jgi:hypothetical protein